MAPSVVTTTLHAFADGNSPGHVCSLGSAPNVGEYDVLGINSDTVVSTPSGFSVGSSRVNAQGSYLFYRKAVGGESSSVTVITSGNFNAEVSHVRLSGLDAVDVTASSTVIGSASNTSNAVSSGTLATATDIVLVFAALAAIGLANQSAPVWSSGYTAITGPNPQGSGSSGMTGFTGWKYPAGTGSESPSVTWSGDAPFNRDTHLIAFTEAAAGGNNAALAGTLGQITSALTAAQNDAAILAGQLGQLTSALTAAQTDRATVAGTLGAITSSLTASQNDRATLAGTLGAVTSAITATSGATAVLAGTLGQLTSALTGSQSDRATLAGTLGQITSTLAATGPVVASTPGRASVGTKAGATAVRRTFAVASASAGTSAVATARKGTVTS